MEPKGKKDQLFVKKTSKNSKLSIKELNIKSEIIDTKNNYGIFILNIQYDGVQSILRYFIEKAKTQKRRVVVPIVLDEIEKEISLRKALERTTDKNDEEGLEEDIVSYQASPDEIMEQVQAKIAECIAANDVFLHELKSFKKLDMLEYWKNTAQTVTYTKGGKKDAKESKKLKEVKETNTNGKGAKGKGKDGIAEKPEDPCKLGTIPKIEMIEKILSNFSATNKDSKPPVKYIEDHPPDALALYVVIIGRVFSDFCMDLLSQNYSLSGVITICPNTIINSSRDGKPLKSLSEELSHSEQTKNVALSNLFLPIISKCQASEIQDEIYNQLSWLLYDIETTRRQHANYLTNLKEIDVSMKEIVLRPDFEAMTNCYIPENATDLIAVPLYLDCLLDSVDEATNIPEEEKEEDILKPYIEIFNKRIIEYGNEILKNMIASNNFDMELYKKYIDTFKLYRHLETLWENVLKGSNTSRLSEVQLLSEATETISVAPFFHDEVTYLEPLTVESVRQRVKSYSNEYDFKYAEYSQHKEEIYICFYNSRDQFHEDCKMANIPTKICFRDYYKYVTEEVAEWTNAQEQIYENNVLAKDRLLKNLKPFSFDPITDKDFVFQPSLKKIIDEKRSVELHISETSVSKVGSKKSRTAVKTSSTLNLSQPRIKEPASNEPEVNLAYNIGDTRFQLNTFRSVFRTTGGTIRLCKDKWTTGEMLLRTDFEYLGHNFLFNYASPIIKDPTFMKIICKNSMIISYQICRAQPPENDSEEISQTASNFETTYYKVNITWPSGLEIRTVHDSRSGEIIAIEQISRRKNISEAKRVYFPNGNVLVFHQDGFMDVLTPNGTFYEAVGINDSTMETFSVYTSADEPNFASSQEKYLHELRLFEEINADINKSKYKFTTPDGFVFETSLGVLVRENRRCFLVEWNDFALGERYSKLENGIKTVLVGNILHVYYPNGTLFTTKTFDDITNERFDADDNSESSETLISIESAPSAIAVTSNILEKILLETPQDRYVSFRRTYKIQHENYAGIHFNGKEIKISCPEKIEIVLKENDIRINIENELYVKCSADTCTVLGQKYPDQNSAVKMVINLYPAGESLLYITSGIDAKLTVTQSGTCAYNRTSTVCSPKFTCPPDKRIVIDKNLEGYEIHKKLDVDKYVNSANEPNTIVHTLNEAITILQPHRDFGEVFKMPIPELNGILKKFEKEDFHCEMLHRPTVDILNEINRDLTIRSFLTMGDYFQRRFPSTAALHSMRISFLDDFAYSKDCGNNVMKFLQMQADRALNYHLDLMKLNLSKLKLPPASSTSSVHTINIMNHIVSTRKRIKIYRQMIRQDFFPKYADFKMARQDIKNLDVSKYEPILDQLSKEMGDLSQYTLQTVDESVRGDRSNRHVKLPSVADVRSQLTGKKSIN